MTRITLAIAAALALAIILPVVAQAQALRTFVSSTGLDTNPCTITQPCRHFQAAVDATAAGGEVDALDPGGYSPITIGQAITIEGQGWSYIAPPAGQPAITITTVSGRVYLHGISLNGVGVTGTTTGILFNSGGSLTVRDSVIRNFTGNGIAFQPNSSTPSKLLISSTLVSDNSIDGIYVNPAVGSGGVTGVVDHVTMENNTGAGLHAASSTENINITVSDSVSSDNDAGIESNGVSVMVRNSTIANNPGTGLFVSGTGSRILVTRSAVTANGVGWGASGLGGFVISYGDNNIDLNTSANSEPPNTLVYH